MATVWSDAYWTGNYTYTRVQVDYSGTSATAILRYTRTNTYSGATGAGTPAGFNFGGGWANMSGVTFYGQQTDAEVCRCGFSISQDGGTYSGSTDGQAGYLGFSGSVWIPSQWTDPSGLSVSITEVQTNGAKFNVNLSNYGNPSNADGRYIEAGICQNNTYGSPYRFSIKQNVKNATIEVNLSSSSSLNIQANKQYYYGAYASNTKRSTSMIQGTFVTKAYAPTFEVLSVTENSVDIAYETQADGGHYSKKVQYSLNNGDTWVDGDTVTTGSASAGGFTISGLAPETTYTLKCRVSTTAGNTVGNDITFTTLEDCKFYGEVGGVTKRVEKLYGSVDGESKEIDKLYGSINGVTTRIF